MISERDIMGGLAKGLAVIETFTSERPRQSISEASVASGLDRATTRRCLLTLAHHGYADYDGKYFTLTPRILRLGTACLATMPLPQLVQPLLDRLSERIGESASVSVLDGHEIVYVARSAQKKVMSIALMPGSRLPAHCTSMGRILLSALNADAVNEILTAHPPAPRTVRTKTDIGAILAELAQVRRQGYALIDQEVEIGLRSIAVPLYNTHGTIVAAINIGTSTSDKENVTELAAKFLDELLKIQSELRQILR